MDAVIIRLIDMPVVVRGVTLPDDEGDYNMFLNARLFAAMRADAYRHEVEHIRLGHFYSPKSVAEKELEVQLREIMHGERDNL